MTEVHEMAQTEVRPQNRRNLQWVSLVFTMAVSLTLPYAVGFGLLVVEAFFFKRLPKWVRIGVGVLAFLVFAMFWASTETHYKTTGSTR